MESKPSAGIDAVTGVALPMLPEIIGDAVEPFTRTLALHPADNPCASNALRIEFVQGSPIRSLAKPSRYVQPVGEADMEANPELSIAYAGSLAMTGELWPVAWLRLKSALEDANPGNPFVHYLLGEVYAANKNYEQSADELRISLKQDPANAETKNALALTYKALGQKAEALQLLSELAESNSKDGEVYYRLAQLQVELGSSQGRHKHAGQIAIRLNPMDSAYHQELADAYRLNQQPAEAERETQQSATVEALNAISHPSGSSN